MEGFSLIDLARQTWMQNFVHIISFFIFLLAILIIILFEDKIARGGRKKSLLTAIRYIMLTVSFVYVGLILKAQPTSTNIVIMLNALIREGSFPIGLFLMEPYIFLSFIFIFITMIVWGRGVFCGWLCPYGAMLELLNKIRKVLLPNFNLQLPEKIHWKLIYFKYALFISILGVSFYNFIAAEYMTEIEPFRTFVLKMQREWYFLLYFVILTIGSVVVYRAFCRYICPLGGMIAIPSFFRIIPFVKLKRYDFCKTCKICTKTCTTGAIKPDGNIDSRECLYCLDCQINFWDEDTCPVLIRKRKETL